jgi:phage terminase large subunit
MKANITIPTLPVYKQLFDLDSGIAILMSGRGTGKTWVASRLANVAVLERGWRCVVVRDEKTKVKETILQDIKNVYDKINDGLDGILNNKYTFTDQGLTNKETKSSDIFTLGFRASSKDDKTKLKGLTDIKLVIIDEAEDVRDYDKVKTLLDTVIRNKALVLFILNTPDKDHWIIKRYFNLEPSEHEGYYNPIPKKLSNVHYFLPTYRDNKKLIKAAVEQYESYGNPESENYDLDHYLSAIQGLVSEGRKGRIYDNWKRISVLEFEKLPYSSKYGLDFGFTNDPTALVEIKQHNNKLYIRQHIYEKQLTNPKIAKKIEEVKISGQVIADSAEPKSIRELQEMGIDIQGAEKGKDSINAGIDKIKNMREVYVCDDSADIWEEYLNYVWELDKNKQPTNQPIDDYNHGLDALRYALESKEFYVGTV